jgi:cysteine desulfurase
MTKKIYLDYNASTPIDPKVREAMLPYLEEHFGNPSTMHWAGKPAKDAFERARGQVASLLNCGRNEVIFTSGGSESNNHVLKGVFFANQEKGNHIITTKVEHPAIMNPCKFLENLGARVTYVGVDQFGQVSPEEVEAAITDQTILVSIMHANNEVGTIQPINDISKITRKNGVLLHTDAAQSVGKVPTCVDELGVDLLTLAGHKLYAPKGIGALYIREGTKLESFIHGASHEEGRRAGTENILLAVGLGEACELACEDVKTTAKVRELRDYFWKQLKDIFGDQVQLNGHPTERLPNTLNVSFIHQIGSEILERIPTIAASTGAACHSGQIELSAVLKEMGITEEIGKGTVRFSLGRYTTSEDINEVVRLLRSTIK